MEQKLIRIRGARVHNLKNISLDLPRDQLIVITGPSGSGKSSLAIDTLFAEGQRKYIESLSIHARQLLGQVEKPDVDLIEGLSPAIAIEQKSGSGDPRSLIATTTELYDHFRLLFAHLGVPHCPESGQRMEALTPSQIVDRVLELPPKSRLMILAPVVQNEKGAFQDVLERLAREGFVRVRVDGQVIELEPGRRYRLDPKLPHWIEAVIDRVIVDPASRTRIADSVELALRWGKGRVLFLYREPEGGQADQWKSFLATTMLMSPVTGKVYEPFTPRHFSFNSPLGACEACNGLGQQSAIDPDLLVQAPLKSLEEGALTVLEKAPRRLAMQYRQMVFGLAKSYQVSIEAPFEYLPQSFKDVLFWGNASQASHDGSQSGRYEGLVPILERLLEQSRSNAIRRWLEKFTSPRPCRKCRGQRLKAEVLAVTIGGEEARKRFGKWLPASDSDRPPIPGLSIMDLCALPIAKAKEFFEWLQVHDQYRQKVASEIINAIRRRLNFLCEVGLGYLTLNRETGTLSGGELQRIRLATQIGSGLTGVIYILDEPSIGLHPRDNERLIRTLKALRDQGNTVIVVEHDPGIIREADYVVDLGPGAGAQGGQVVAAGTVQELLKNPDSLTAKYLRGELTVPGQERRLSSPGDHGWLIIRGAKEHNLKNITVRFPLKALSCVTGVSGSGKSTLVDEILRRAVARRLYGSQERPGQFDELIGVEQIQRLVVVDQSPIGRTPRSNPATYTGIFDHIRELFAKLPAARIRGFNSSRFSFNVAEGRCHKCQGDGYIKLEMSFLPPVYVLCDSCEGKRYNRETLEVTYKGLNIADVLELSFEEAAHFFRNIPSIADICRMLCEVGLGYLKLGQPATTLSGGEAQRLKLAAELGRKSALHTLYLLDEPTTGLHFHDVARLMEVLYRLRDAGHTLIVVEHNLDVIKGADWIVDLGPEGGDEGGWVVAEGPPHVIASNPLSHTGRYLRQVLCQQEIPV